MLAYTTSTASYTVPRTASRVLLLAQNVPTDEIHREPIGCRTSRGWLKVKEELTSITHEPQSEDIRLDEE